MTNGDKIRGMVDDELTDMLHKVTRACWDGICRKDCPLSRVCGCDWHEMRDWLKQEVSDNG